MNNIINYINKQRISQDVISKYVKSLLGFLGRVIAGDVSIRADIYINVTSVIIDIHLNRDGIAGYNFHTDKSQEEIIDGIGVKPMISRTPENIGKITINGNNIINGGNHLVILKDYTPSLWSTSQALRDVVTIINRG